LPQPLVKIIAYGQQAGAFKPEPNAMDVGTYHTNALLMRVLTRPDETAEETAGIVLSQNSTSSYSFSQPLTHLTQNLGIAHYLWRLSRMIARNAWRM
jgi:hypothetical protein